MFFTQSINYLLMFSYNIFLYCNLILSDSVNKNEIEAYKILSNVLIYTCEYNKTDFFNNYLIKEEDGDLILKLSNIYIMNIEDFEKEVPIKSIFFEFQKGSNNISSIELKNKKIVISKTNKLFGFIIDENIKTKLENIKINEKIIIKIKINETIDEFIVCSIFINNNKVIISTNPYYKSNINTYKSYIDNFKVDTSDFDSKRYFKFVSLYLKYISLQKKLRVLKELMKKNIK